MGSNKNKNKNWVEMIWTRFFGDDKIEIIRNDYVVKMIVITSELSMFYFLQNPKFLKMCFYEIIENFI